MRSPRCFSRAVVSGITPTASVQRRARTLTEDHNVYNVGRVHRVKEITAVRRLLILGFLATTCLIGILPASAAKGSPEVLCQNLLAAEKGCSLNRAFAGLWLNQDLPLANQRLRLAWDEAMGEHETLAPDVADEQFKWQMRTWVRIYYLFGPAGHDLADRLSPDNTRRIESLFWNYAAAKSTLARADLANVWFIQGSENHDMMDLGNAFLAAQALVEHPDYAIRTLPDGGTLREHAAAWTAYFTRYCAERVRHGLLIEFASPTYGKYYVPELVNLVDFAGDRALRKGMENYLHLIWSDWAIEQLHGIRGGAKARCYQGKYSQNGASDSWYLMGQLLLGEGDWSNAARYNHPILGFGPILATSGYTLSDVVNRLATSPEARGEYVYQSRRPGRMTHVDPLPSQGGQSCWYHMNGADSGFIRYSWCTPDHILGSYGFDPALREDFQIYPDEPDRAARHYAAISTQNLWQGVIFGTGPNARIFPQCTATPDKNNPEVSITYIQQVAVQHENVLLVQANRAHPAITAFRMYFGPGMKARLVERNGWYLLEEGHSYAALRFFARKDGAPAAVAWHDDNFLTAEDRWAPAAIVTARTTDLATLDEFVSHLGHHTFQVRDEKLLYSFTARAGAATTLGLYLEKAQLPEKNGIPIDLAPDRVYDSPFIMSEPGRDPVLNPVKGSGI